MAQTRLTAAIKEALVDKLIERAFTDRSQKLVDAECALAQDIYDDFMNTRMIKTKGGYGDPTPMRKVVDALPAGWQGTSDYFKAEMGGDVVKFDRYEGIVDGWRANQNDLVGVKEIPSRDQHKWTFQPGFSGNCAVHVYDAKHAFSSRTMELQGLRKDLVSEISTMRGSTRGALGSVTTIQKLIMIWPEVEAFAAPYLQEKTAILPVIARERLNDALGLPPGVME